MPEEDGGTEQLQDLWVVWLRVWSEHWGAHCSYGVLVPAAAGRMPTALRGLQSADVQSQPCHWHRGPGLEPLLLWLKPMGGDFEVSRHIYICVFVGVHKYSLGWSQKKKKMICPHYNVFYFKKKSFLPPTSWSWGERRTRITLTTCLRCISVCSCGLRFVQFFKYFNDFNIYYI